MSEITMLVSKGYVTQEGRINHEKINHLSGATTSLLVETIWEISGQNMDILERLYKLLRFLYEQHREMDIYEIIIFLCDLIEIDFPKDAILLCSQQATRNIYFYELIMDMQDIMYDYAETE